MRTKALLLTAMLGVAGIASSYAQNVYSVNVVGYVNLTLTNEYSLVANQLDDGAGNLVTNIFKSGLPLQTVIYKFDGTSYKSVTYLGTLWNPVANRNMTMAPGEGVFIKKPVSAPQINVTFTGEVLEGDLVNPVAVGFGIYSAMVPQQGGITAVHNYVPANQDVVYRYNGAYSSKTWLTALNRWNPAGEPELGVGEAVFINSKTVKDWTRSFTVPRE